MDFKMVEDCIMNDYFVDSNEPERERIKYCELNCQFRCLRGMDYKKRSN